MEPGFQLPDSVSRLVVEEKQIFLVGTAHVSPQSVVDVRTAIETLKPDTVCVELCPARHRALMQQPDWKNMDIYKVIKEKKVFFLLAQLLMGAFYRRIGEQLGVQPGAELVEAVTQAQHHQAALVLADRDIDITLKRVWGYLSVWNKCKMALQLAASILFVEKIDQPLVESLKAQDQLESMLATFAKAFPEVKKRLIDERDIYLSQNIRNATGKTIVAVIGAGHVPGIKQHITGSAPLAPLMQVPPQSVVPTVLKWALPVLIVALLIFGFFKGGSRHGIESLSIWIIVNGGLAGLGAALACAHPLTIAASFLGAPLTSLNPMIAAGWVAGLVQAWIKKPTVADIEELPKDLETLKGFWTNPVSRILLVVVLANVGSSLGTLISGSWIALRNLQ